MVSFLKNKKLIYLPFDCKGIFIERKNKFLGLVEINRKIYEAHIHDPGRLTKILYKGNEVLIQKIDGIKRKTKYEIVFGKYYESFVLINSKFHNKIAEKILNSGFINEIKKIKVITREAKINKSKIDFLVIDENNKEFFIEVKGCTLENENIALFPDAPTIRGSRHLEELHNLINRDKLSILIILIFIKEAKLFMPNKEIDIKFYKNFISCIKKGLKVYPFKIEYNLKDQYLYLTELLPLKII